MKVERLYVDSKLPVKAHADDAGFDLYAMETVFISPGQTVKVPVGVAVAIPKGHVGLLCGRSSMNARGILTHTGIIDCGYTGELGAVFTNVSTEFQELRQGHRVAQLVVTPIYTGEVEEVVALDPTNRGSGSFGSSGL